MLIFNKFIKKRNTLIYKDSPCRLNLADSSNSVMETQDIY
jgi:hypothetical protein